jgi:hypothetical protein
VRYDDRILSRDPSRWKSRRWMTGGSWSTPSRATASPTLNQFRQAVGASGGIRRRSPKPARFDPARPTREVLGSVTSNDILSRTGRR